MRIRLVLTYLVMTAAVLAILEIPLGLSYEAREEDKLLVAVERDARVIATAVEDWLEGRVDDPSTLDPAVVAAEYQAQVGGRVVVVDADGISVVDSGDPQGEARDFSTREEFVEALAGRLAAGLRSSETLGTDLIYVAVPVASSGTVIGAVRITYPRSELDQRVTAYWGRLALVAVVVLAGVGAAGVLLASTVTRPVARLRSTTARLAAGDLTARAEERAGPPELRALADDVDAMAARLELLVGSQQAFVADASHQLRSPLTALRLRLENLADEVSPTDTTTTGELDAALDETDRLQRLVDGLLSLARAGTTRPGVVRVDAAAIARDRVAVWSPLAEDRGILLDVVAPASRPTKAVDGALEQILDNLLANALEATPRGRSVRVDVVDDRPGPGPVRIRVSDEGPGMSDEQLARATDRFWRSPGTPWAGTGLGLAIVAELARQSHGTCRLARNPAGGLEATVELPDGAP